jgi:hypothetical protein
VVRRAVLLRQLVEPNESTPSCRRIRRAAVVAARRVSLADGTTPTELRLHTEGDAVQLRGVPYREVLEEGSKLIHEVMGGPARPGVRPLLIWNYPRRSNSTI